MKDRDRPTKTRHISKVSEHSAGSQFVLPRQGWQDKQAWSKAVIKAKRALDIAEISNLFD